MNAVDVLIVAFFAFEVWNGWRRGLTAGLVSLGALLAALFAAFKLAVAASNFAAFVHDPAIRYSLVFALVFALVYFVGQVVASRFSRGRKGTTSSALGSVVSLAEGVVFVGAVAHVLSLSKSTIVIVKGSALAELLRHLFALYLLPVMR